MHRRAIFVVLAATFLAALAAIAGAQDSSAVQRCRAACQEESRRCDRSCEEESDEDARRGCLRQCGSRYHISCPSDCERGGGAGPPPPPG